MPIVAIGSLAFDSIETPFGKAPKILGGSVNYFSLAASYFTPVWCVSVVGEDFPQEHLDLLVKKGVDISGIRKEAGQTFHWAGKYEYDLNTAHTLSTQLNVFERFDPTIPEKYKAGQYIFLGNTAPHIQMKVLDQIDSPKVVALDTMNFWIESYKNSLIDVLKRVHIVIINEGEARQLTQSHNLVQVGRAIQKFGPRTVVIKRGEYGAVLFHENEIFSLPGLPLGEVKDPTGAGDTFAGGFMGYLASNDKADLQTLRRATVYGSVLASFTVQDFGFKELLGLSQGAIEKRYRAFIDLTRFHESA